MIRKVSYLLGATILASVLVFGCALNYHTAPRYRYYPPAAEQIEADATAICQEMGELSGTPTTPFFTDGCSMWPDGNWQECCVTHDIVYWCGGTYEQRMNADHELRECVSENFYDWMGWLMEVGVWPGGSAWLPTPFRWGYGHKYPAGYAEPQ